MTSQATLVESRVDYLTASVMLDKLASGEEVERSRTIAAKLLMQQESAGNDVRRWASHSFKGFQVGQLCYGESGTGMLFRVSGDAARDNWESIYDVSTNVARLDVAATVKLNGAWSDMSRVHLDEARQYQREHSPKLKVTRIDGGKHGCTLNIGSRSSDAFGRIYDKEAESKNEAWQDCWRYEVEFKRSMAEQAAALLSDASIEQVDPAALAFSWLARRIKVPEGLLNLPCNITARPLQPSDSARTLRWVRTGVKPSVRRLIERGMLRDVLAALGIHSDMLASAGYVLQPPTDREEC